MGMFGSPSIPPLPPAPEPSPPPTEQVDLDALAAQRRERDANRRGRSALVIDPSLSTPPANATGLSIPQ